MVSEKNDIEIDLAFHKLSNEKIMKTIDLETISFLNNDEIWIDNFSLWLAFLEENDQLNYPEALRKKNYYSIGLQFTDDATISIINKKWLGKDMPTDVLSFPVIDDNTINLPSKIIELGDIIVSVQTAQKQANSYNQNLSRELTWLVCHGFLHLLGWDHLDSESLDKMLNVQNQLLALDNPLEAGSTKSL